MHRNNKKNIFFMSISGYVMSTKVIKKMISRDFCQQKTRKKPRPGKERGHFGCFYNTNSLSFS